MGFLRDVSPHLEHHPPGAGACRQSAAKQTDTEVAVRRRYLSAKRAVALPDSLQEVWQVNAILLHLVIEIADSTSALIPHCPSMLAQLRNDPVPVKVIADEHQFRHGPVCIRVRMYVAVMGCRVGVRLVMSVMV